MTMTMKKVKNTRRCRLCACEERCNNFYNIFDNNSDSELEMKITKLLPVVVLQEVFCFKTASHSRSINVTPWDAMPHVVCSECIGKLNSFNDFYEASLKAEKVLENLDSSVWRRDLENGNHVIETPTQKQQEESSKDQEEVPRRPVRTLDCFIVNKITSKQSVYTCRHCYRTFTKESSALMHYCVELQDCGEDEEEDDKREGDEDGEGKSLPPLKIRLFSVKSGLFVCYLCEMQFGEKTQVVEHIKKHFVDGRWGNGIRRKKKSRRCREENDEEESYTKGRTKKKRKKSMDSPKIGERQNRRESSPKNEKTTGDETQTVVHPTAEEIQNLEGKEGHKSDEEGGSRSEDSSDEVTILEVIDRKSTIFSACVFCDKIFSTKEALVAHQNRHMLGYPVLRSEKVQTVNGISTAETLMCTICGMSFTNRPTLLHHVQFHVDVQEQREKDSFGPI